MVISAKLFRMRNQFHGGCLEFSVEFSYDYLNYVFEDLLRNHSSLSLAIDDHFNQCQVGSMDINVADDFDRRSNFKNNRKRYREYEPFGGDSKVQKVCSCGGVPREGRLVEGKTGQKRCSKLCPIINKKGPAYRNLKVK